MTSEKKNLRNEKIAACHELFIKLRGRDHQLIEAEMRLSGWPNFSRRSLYARKSGRGQGPGWIAQYGWQEKPGAGTAGALACSAGNAGALACIAAKAATELRQQTSPSIDAIAGARHTGGTGVAGEGARVPGDFESFQEWLKRVSPTMTWTWKHQIYIYKQLQRVTDGICKRLMIFLPPRHGKSELVTVRYSAWRLRQKPEMNIILASYNQRLANRFSRKIRRVLCDDAFLSGPTAPTGSEPPALARSEPPALAGGMNANALTVPGSERINSNGAETRDIPQVVPPAYAGGSDALPQRMFPFLSSKPPNSIAEWGTAAGGGLRAVGVGSGVTGFGADLIVIDDPVKNRAQAESATFRDNVWQWYNDDIYTRLEPGASLVLIQTRWHEDDLAGRLLQRMKDGGEEWEVVNLPALAERKSDAETRGRGEAGLALASSAGNAGALASIAAQAATEDGLETSLIDVAKAGTRHTGGTGVAGEGACGPGEGGFGGAARGGDWRVPGEALCPERFDEQKLAGIRAQLGSYSFSALYQQRPTPADGAKFKRAWLRNVISAAPPNLKWFRGYDLAISTKTSADYTASFRVAKDKSGNIYIADGFRKRIEYPEQRRFILGRIKAERDTQHGIEDSLHGKAIVQDLRQNDSLSSMAFQAVRVVGDKVTRSLAWANVAEEGKLHLVRGPWIETFVEELIRFPKGKHDDQVDAVSIAIGMLADKDKRMHVFD